MAPVGGFSLLAVLVYVADEYLAVEAGTRTLQASVPSTKRSPEYARWHLRAPDLSTVRNAFLRCYQEREIAIDCPSKAQSL